MARAMRKHVISVAWLACLVLSGCQVFTAGEQVSEPDPAQVRSARAAEANKGHDEASKAKEHRDPHGDPHGGAPAAEPGESATAAHILIRFAGAMRSGPDMTRSKDDAKKLAEKLAAQAKQPGANFAALADEYTEDPSGKGRGGKLGTFTRGRMVKEFEEATFGLEPGGVSGVVETAFGYHIIHREK
jgi:hypothetical protein